MEMKSRGKWKWAGRGWERSTNCNTKKRWSTTYASTLRVHVLCRYGSISFRTRSGPISDTITSILFMASVRTITSAWDVSCRKKSNGDKSPVTDKSDWYQTDKARDENIEITCTRINIQKQINAMLGLYVPIMHSPAFVKCTRETNRVGDAPLTLAMN